MKNLFTTNIITILKRINEIFKYIFALPSKLDIKIIFINLYQYLKLMLPYLYQKLILKVFNYWKILAHIVAFLNLIFTIIIIISYTEINWGNLGVLTTLFTILIKLTPIFIVDFIGDIYLIITSVFNSTIRNIIIKILDIDKNHTNIEKSPIDNKVNIEKDEMVINKDNNKSYLNYYIIGGVLLIITLGCIYYIGWDDLMDYFKKIKNMMGLILGHQT